MSDAFTNFLLLQRFFAHALLCDDWLKDVNIVTRDEVIESGSRLADDTIAAESLVYCTPRNGRSGAGVLIEMPELIVKSLDTPGPQADVQITCTVFEDTLQNLAGDSGTLRPADQIGQKILDIGHQWVVEGLGVYGAAERGLREANEWRPIRAFNAYLRMRMNRRQTERVARVEFTWAVSDPKTTPVSLACQTPGAAIYYTINGKFPGPSEPSAILYAAPFDAPAGTVILAAAHKQGMILSPVARRIVGSTAIQSIN